MILDAISPERIIFEVTHDNKNYLHLFDLNPNYFSTLRCEDNVYPLFMKLIISGKTLRTQSEFLNFRIKLLKHDFEILIYSDCPVLHIPPIKDAITTLSLETAKLLYSTLTKKEKSVLLFLYRGHKTSRLNVELKITVQTYRTHKKHIFEKMNFHSQIELRNWCELYFDKIS